MYCLIEVFDDTVLLLSALYPINLVVKLVTLFARRLIDDVFHHDDKVTLDPADTFATRVYLLPVFPCL